MTNCFGPRWPPDYYPLRSADIPSKKGGGTVLVSRDFKKLCSVAVGKLMELHGEGGAGGAAKATGDDTGAKVERADGYEPPIQETV